MRVGRAFVCVSPNMDRGRVPIRSSASVSAFGVTIFIVRSGGSLSARPRLVRPRLPVAAWLHRWTLPCAAAAPVPTSRSSTPVLPRRLLSS